MRKDESTSAKKSTAATNKQPKLRWQSLADAGHPKADEENKDATPIRKRRPRSSALNKKFAFFDLVTNRAREANTARTDDEEEARGQSTTDSMEAMPNLTTDELNEMADNFLQIRHEDEEEEEVETPNNSDLLPVANRVSAREVTILSGDNNENDDNDRETVVTGFLVTDTARKVLREPIYSSVPWLTPFCLLITGAFLLAILVVSLVVALTKEDKNGFFPTASPSPTLSMSPTMSVTFWPSTSALPSLRPSMSPSAPPTERPSLSLSPTALPTMANVTWSRVGTDLTGTADHKGLGRSVALSLNGNELRVSGDGVLRVYLLAGTDDWILNQDLSDSITDWGSVAVSHDGYTIVASDPYHNRFVGRAVVYRRVGATWEQRGDPLVGEKWAVQFGSAVSMSSNGTVVVVGAPGQGGEYVDVYLDEEGTSGNHTLVARIEGDAGSWFGVSLTASADASRLFVGAPRADDDGRENVGAVFSYSLFTEHAALLQRLDGDEAGDQFGRSVAASSDGDVLAVGALGAGYVKVYAANDSSERRFSSLADRLVGTAGSQFGHALALSADGARLAVGAYSDGQNGFRSGRVFVYAVCPRRHQRIGEFGGDAPWDYFGFSVSLSGDGARLAVGAQDSDAGGRDSGLVRVFESS